MAKATRATGWKGCNLRTTFGKLITRAGLEPWPRLFHNLRSSRETELLEEFSVHVVSLWMGHDAKVSLKHYAQTTDEHYDRAASGAESGSPVAQKAAQRQPVASRAEVIEVGANGDGVAVVPLRARQNFLMNKSQAEREGFEPSVGFHPHRFSRPAQSATLSPLRRATV